jgi:hypothetical protein
MSQSGQGEPVLSAEMGIWNSKPTSQDTVEMPSHASEPDAQKSDRGSHCIPKRDMRSDVESLSVGREAATNGPEVPDMTTSEGALTSALENTRSNDVQVDTVDSGVQGETGPQAAAQSDTHVMSVAVAKRPDQIKISDLQQIHAKRMENAREALRATEQKHLQSERHLRKKIAKLEKQVSRHKSELESQEQSQKQWQQELESAFGQKEHQYRTDIATLTQSLKLRDGELASMRRTHKATLRDLEGIKDKVFASQPMEGKSDNELKEQYRELCASVEYWVDNHFRDSGNLIDVIRLAPNSRQSKNIISCFLTKEDRKLAIEHPQLGLVILQAYVWRYLYGRLLAEEEMYPGLANIVKDYLKRIIKGMGDLKPAKGEIPPSGPEELLIP